MKVEGKLVALEKVTEGVRIFRMRLPGGTHRIVHIPNNFDRGVGDLLFSVKDGMDNLQYVDREPPCVDCGIETFQGDNYHICPHCNRTYDFMNNEAH